MHRVDTLVVDEVTSPVRVVDEVTRPRPKHFIGTRTLNHEHGNHKKAGTDLYHSSRINLIVDECGERIVPDSALNVEAIIVSTFAAFGIKPYGIIGVAP